MPNVIFPLRYIKDYHKKRSRNTSTAIDDLPTKKALSKDAVHTFLHRQSPPIIPDCKRNLPGHGYLNVDQIMRIIALISMP